MGIESFKAPVSPGGKKQEESPSDNQMIDTVINAIRGSSRGGMVRIEDAQYCLKKLADNFDLEGKRDEATRYRNLTENIIKTIRQSARSGGMVNISDARYRLEKEIDNWRHIER